MVAVPTSHTNNFFIDGELPHAFRFILISAARVCDRAIGIVNVPHKFRCFRTVLTHSPASVYKNPRADSHKLFQAHVVSISNEINKQRAS